MKIKFSIIFKRIRPSPYNIVFGEEKQCEVLCEKNYKADDDKIKFLKHGMMFSYEQHWIIGKFYLSIANPPHFAFQTTCQLHGATIQKGRTDFAHLASQWVAMSRKRARRRMHALFPSITIRPPPSTYSTMSTLLFITTLAKVRSLIHQIINKPVFFSRRLPWFSSRPSSSRSPFLRSL